MGLDMYLMKRENNDDITQLMYWRKANAIHNWFITHGREYVNGNLVAATGDFNCGCIPVDRNMIKELCNDIQTVIDNPKQAHKIIPVCQGFFFGSYEYNEGYFDDLRTTLDNLKPLLDDDLNWGDLSEDEVGDIYYTCWW